MSTSQKQAVCSALISTLKERGIDYEPNGEVIIKDVLIKDDYEKVRTIITEGLENGLISFTEQAKAKYIGNEVEMKKYVSGLIKNWVKKNPEFNNNQKYVPTNPGSRTGSGDEQIRAMRALKKTTTDESILIEIDKEIASRLAIIKPKQTITIDVDQLPESLRHLVK